MVTAPNMEARSAPAPLRPIALGPARIEVETRPDGAILMRSAVALGPYPTKLTDRLFEGAARHPDRVLFAQRDPARGGAWRTVSHGEAARQVTCIGQALLDRRLTAERPIAILSGSGIEHGLLALAAMHVGVPYASITPAYCLLDPTLARLRHVLGLLTPGLVFVDDPAAFANALAHGVDPRAEVVTTGAPAGPRPLTAWSDLVATAPGAQVAAAAAAVTGDTVAKILFTSGSTGFPKGVINTQRMVCSNQQMFVEALPAFAEEPPVLVSWLPWHHTSGGNQITGLAVYCGGTLYIDDGKPLPEAIGETVRNLKEIPPTAYFTVPRGFAELCRHFRADPALARTFFSRVRLFYYSGAAMPDPVSEELDRIAAATCGQRIPMFSGYGATETAPFALCANWPNQRGGLAGLPVPGVELKLAPTQGKYEARIKGPNVMPGYWRQPGLTAAAFDEEGYIKLGDALSFVDPRDPSLGLAFDGRIAEDFKLSTGTWVNVGRLREQLAAGAGAALAHAVIAGESRDQVGALIFPSLPECRGLAGLADDTPAEAVIADPTVRAHFRSVLEALAAASTGTSTLIARALLLAEPPFAAAGELTDKGSVNQRAVVARRTEAVAALFAASPPPEVLIAAPGRSQPSHRKDLSDAATR